MKIHWLIKYYVVAFIIIFTFVYYIEKTEPDINWSLYQNVSEDEVLKAINQKDCRSLSKLYLDEYNLNYKKNYLGFTIRKDKKSIKGLNLLKYIDFHLKKYNCINV